MMKREWLERLLFILSGIACGAAAVMSLTPRVVEMPRTSLTDFRYLGSFKAPFGRYGACQIAFNPDGDNGRGSLFITGGGSDSFTIGEIDIPEPVDVHRREDLGLLRTARVLQNPSDIYSRIPRKAASWPQGQVNRYDGGNYAVFGGLIYENGKLFFNAYTYYDGNASETATTGRIENPAALAGSAVAGMFHNAGAARTSGWMAVIPPEWRPRLGGTHLTGHDNGPPILSRLSAGPSLFVFNLADTAAAADGAVIPTIPRINYPDVSGSRSIWNDDMANLSKTNKVWTLMTQTGFGMIVPGTRTYALLGTAGGFNANPANPWHGTSEPAFSPPYAGTIIYKRTDTLGYTYGGPGVWDARDRHYMYAFFDLEEILSAANPWEPRPYENGIFPAPFPRYGGYTVAGQMPDTIRGGTWDPVSGRLYLALAAAVNDEDPEYSGNPVIAVYEFRTEAGDEHTILATADRGGSIVPSGRVVVPDGGSRVFDVTPDEGHRIHDVEVDGRSIGPVAQHTFTAVTSDHTIHARFAALSPGPAVIIVKPNGGETLRGWILVLARIQGDRAVSAVNLLIDGDHPPVARLIGIPLPTWYGWIWDSRTYTDGPHTIRVEAEADNGGRGWDEIEITLANR